VRAIRFYKIASVVFFAVFAAQSVLAVEPDAIEVDALKYSHKKRFAEITPYALLTSADSERLGVGASVVVKSYDHVLVEAGLAFLPIGTAATNSGTTELNYVATPVTLKFFTNKTNLGLFFKGSIVPSYLASAKNDQDRFKNTDTQIWVGLGGLFSSQMQNRVYFDLVWARSLSSIMKDENVYNEGLIFSTGLTL
jgi:hypothetical protein